MSAFYVLVQEGHEAEMRRQELIDGLKEMSADSFGDDPSATQVKWHVVPKGFAWTGGKPSHSSIIRCVIPDGLTYETRAGFMMKICELWVQQTGCDGMDVMITT